MLYFISKFIPINQINYKVELLQQCIDINYIFFTELLFIIFPYQLLFHNFIYVFYFKKYQFCFVLCIYLYCCIIEEFNKLQGCHIDKLSRTFIGVHICILIVTHT